MSTMTTAPATFANGDEVIIDHPGYTGRVYVIERVKKTRALIKLKDNPNGRGLDALMSMLRHVDPNAPATPPLSQFMHPSPAMTAGPGEVVRLKRPFHSNTTDTLMVVTKVNSTTLSLDPLGGRENGTPMRIGPTGVVKVPLADILR